MNNPKVSSLVNNSPTSLSPLRKSINVRNVSSTNISENDDEAERISRRRVQTTSVSSVTPSGNSNKRHSLSSAFLANIPASKMAECINECIKLSTENKINTKNAFSLEIIDFMTYMIKKQDVNMSSLQVASTSLDVSSKIYGFRVDSVHSEILKIIGGLDKQTTEAESKSDEDGEVADEDANDKEESKKKKKKKHNRQRIITTTEALAGRVEVIKPMSIISISGDQQTSDMLSLASLPNHATSGFYVHPYNDVLVDVTEDTFESQNDTDMKYNISAIEDFSNLEICLSYSNFEFLNWSVDNEPQEMETEEAEDKESDNRFQFDLNASVEHDDNDDPAPEPMNYFDIEHDDENKENYVHGCYRELANRPNENIRTVQAQSNITSEYSFVQPNLSLHWAGPSHWKFRNIARLSATADKVMTCKQGPLRKRKQIELSYHENNDVIDAKYAPSHSNKLPGRTAKEEWSTEAITLPEDVHYDVKLLFRLYLNEKISMNTEKTSNEKNDAIALDISDNERYDYNNPNDTMEYCPGVNNDDYDENGADDCNVENDAMFNTQGFTGDNLVAAPKLANKIPITFCVRAKKIDMRQLKKSIWISLNSKSDTDVDVAREEINEATTMKTSKQFSDVYKTLPKLLTKSNAEALSAPMAFLSLLHLANEKELSLSSLPDMSDIVVMASSEENTNGETQTESEEDIL